MEKALKIVLEFLKSMAMPVSEFDEVKNVCLVSSNHDEEIASIVAGVLTSVGLDGTLNIVESPTGKNDFKLVNGLIFNRGLVSENFV